jgi:stage II sporulation protein AA (anti-sigma F factor antagonist)
VRPADLRSELRDGVVCARIAGEIDMSNADELRAAVTESTPNEAIGVVLDLSKIDYLDSAGIHLIFRLRESLRMRSQRLAIVIPENSPVNDALRLAGINRAPDVVQTLDEGQKVLLAGETSDSCGSTC